MAAAAAALSMGLDREAVRNLELASQTESGSFDLWRLMATGYSKLNNPGMTSLARAEMASARRTSPIVGAP